MSSAVCVCVFAFQTDQKSWFQRIYVKVTSCGFSTKKELTIKIKFSKTVLEITVSDNSSTFK